MKAFNLKRIIGTAISLTTLVIWGGGAEVAAQTITISPSGTICVGDTIKVTATADNIEDLIVPKGTHWSGDADDAVVSKTGNTITKRFYTYHPYQTNDPEAATPQSFDFTIRYNGTTTTKPQTITAKSCPPTPLSDPGNTKDVSLGSQYNLGIVYFEYTFTNPPSNPARISFVPTFTPYQPLRLSQQRLSTNRQWEIRYHAIQISDATYSLDVFYNEGDSLNRKKTFGPYNIPLKEDLGSLQPDASGYCPGSPLVFSLELSSKWQSVMNQTIGNDESKIGGCFDWSGSPTPVTFTRREGSKYFFSTTVSGTATDDYHCKLKAQIKYQNAANAALASIKFDSTVIYDVPIVQPTYHAAAGFTQHEQTICPGDPLDPSLTQLTAPGVTVQEYLDADGKKIPTPGYYVPTKSGAITAVITAPCAWEDKLQVTIVDAAQFQSANIPPDTLICAGSTLSFSASANSDITWNIMSDASAETDSWTDTENGIVHTRTFSANAWVTAVVSKCGKTAMKEFNVRAVPQPEGVTMNRSEASGCPGTEVSLSGSAASGSTSTYTLYDRRANKDITAEMQAYISPTTGLTNYPLRPNDNLRLTYTVSNTTNASGFAPASLTCSKSAEANIIANAQPTVRIRALGTTYDDGGTACVPRETDFQLTASGADSYIWLDDPSVTTAERNLTLGNDGTVRVRGVESLNGCADTASLRCLVSVESPNRVKADTVCPGEEFCFEADLLPGTTYAWIGHDGLPLDDTTARLCDVIQIKLQRDADYTYTLQTQREMCDESLLYNLKLKRTPNIASQTNLIGGFICVGDQLAFNYSTGLPADEHPLFSFTQDGAPVSGGHEGNGDTYLYSKNNVQPADAGRYILTVTPVDLHPCPASDTVDVQVEEPADVQIEIVDLDGITTNLVCEGSQTRLIATVSPAADNYRYRWENDNRIIYDAYESDITVIWQRADDGPLYLTVQQNVCDAKANTTVSVIPTPQLNMPKDTNLCEGLSLCLDPAPDIEPEEFGWFCIQGNRMITLPDQASLPYCLENADASMNGGYFVLVTHVVNGQRCTKWSDTTQVTVRPTPDITIDGPDYICERSTVMLRAVSRTPGTVIWNYNNSTDETIEVSDPGRYEVTRITPYGCENTAEHYLVLRALPYFSLPPDTSICRGTDIMIYGPDDMDFYLWNDGVLTKDRLVDAAGEYSLTVERNGCSYRDDINISMTFCGQFHFPTAFSPNDNRVNDTWGAISSAKDDDMAEFDLMVFDRNGKKVFHGKQISEQWDGTYKGELCPPGVYTYSFKALEKLDGIQYRTNGTVTIVR